MYKAVWYDPHRNLAPNMNKPTPCWLLNAVPKDGYNDEAVIVLDVEGVELPLKTVKLKDVRLLRRVTGVLEE